jgi:hypothetical protein
MGEWVSARKGERFPNPTPNTQHPPVSRSLLIPAVLVTAFYAAVSSLWWYPTGSEAAPAEAARIGGGGMDRGFPIVALRRYPDLYLELDGKRVPVEGTEADARRRFSESLRHKPRPKVDPVIIAGVSASSVDITRVEPRDGPRPGAWDREEHWIRASWSDGDARHERAWNASDIIRAFEREVGRGQEPEAVFLEMGPPVREARPVWFLAVAVWLLCGWAALASGLCEGKSPRTLFGRTLAALVLGPAWVVLAWLFGMGPRLLLRRWRPGS